ncbi:hypothetical protein LWC35_35125 [Pseudonocardia kujensis]|uniref:hypothetical protein n=1 Tax=Pseudonocardia kujensis TaxID=1128675 RepID=UPI001E472E75|nr:hypothetical protein [Pseudonocardia kujensis]MCE0768089.1 hypothetical protein [Pseudonocardia kujensis]
MTTSLATDDDRALIDFAERWYGCGGGFTIEIYTRFRLCQSDYFTQLLDAVERRRRREGDSPEAGRDRPGRPEPPVAHFLICPAHGPSHVVEWAPPRRHTRPPARAAERLSAGSTTPRPPPDDAHPARSCARSLCSERQLE